MDNTTMKAQHSPPAGEIAGKRANSIKVVRADGKITNRSRAGQRQTSGLKVPLVKMRAKN